MRVAFDTVILAAYLHPTAKYPKPVTQLPERLAYLVKELQTANATIIIPTPALSEFLVLAAGDGPAYLKVLTENRVFSIEPFDQRAAIEAAASHLKAAKDGDKRGGASGSWQKVKVDRQIAAIAKVNDVDKLYSDDDDVYKLGTALDIVVTGAAELPLPPVDPQLQMPDL